MSYTPLFTPGSAAGAPDRATRAGDRTPGADRYEYDARIELAVNVALAAGRPLLVRGRPGTGKSSLARSVAQNLGRRFYATTVSSRTQARDLLWTFDTVARLADAQIRKLQPDEHYVVPGVLWWAFDSVSAAELGRPDPGEGSGDRAVVLLDEIDKADPDVPNDLLLPLGSYQFARDGGQPVIAKEPPLVILTSNDERDLPQAFLRRCVVLVLEEPGPERLRRIAERHFPDLAGSTVLTKTLEEYARANQATPAAGPSVAELLDLLAALTELDAPPGSQPWDDTVALVLEKATGPLP